eukprot:GHUV01040673.1.p2 GENE.GHUV01040673.1~~GHUV01040673.1.p2  ORF type:complete len:121 (+),score=15.99 GHUV01040673.1:484-846(+)
MSSAANAFNKAVQADTGLIRPWYACSPGLHDRSIAVVKARWPWCQGPVAGLPLRVLPSANASSTASYSNCHTTTYQLTQSALVTLNRGFLPDELSMLCIFSRAFNTMSTSALNTAISQYW